MCIDRYICMCIDRYMHVTLRLWTCIIMCAYIYNHIYTLLTGIGRTSWTSWSSWRPWYLSKYKITFYLTNS